MINLSKNLLFLGFIFALTFTGCIKDDPEPTPEGSDPIELECSIDNDLILTNDLDKPVDYIVTCDVNINAKLTIEAGTVIEFQSNTGLDLTNESGASIIAKGSATLPIIMRGTTDQVGFWKGLHIENNNVTNELTYVIISGGGSGSFTGLDTKANIRIGEVSNPGKIKIVNCTIEKSGGAGISTSQYAGQDAIKGFSTNIIKDCATYPMDIVATQAHELDQNSVYTGSTKNYIYINGGSGTLLGDHIWNDTGTPFLINDDITVGYNGDQGSLTINEGATLLFQSNRGLKINSTGYLAVEGSASNPVKIGGETPVADAWKGIFVRSNDTRNSIDYCILTDGGSASHDGANIKSLVRIGTVGSCCDNAKLKISNSTLARVDCVYYLYGDDVALTESNVTKENYTNEYCN